MYAMKLAYDMVVIKFPDWAKKNDFKISEKFEESSSNEPTSPRKKVSKNTKRSKDDSKIHRSGSKKRLFEAQTKKSLSSIIASNILVSNINGLSSEKYIFIGEDIVLSFIPMFF